MDFRQDSITVVPGRYLIDQQFLFCSLYTNFKKELGWSVVVHTCNPSYKGGEDWEDHGLRPVLAKKDPISTSKPGVVVCTCGLSYMRGIDRRITVQSQPWAKM
jgi:hypothetical protein